MDQAEIERRFVYIPPNEQTREIHNAVRGHVLTFAEELNTLLPGESREKSLFFTALEEASFWAHAHIARNVGREV